MLVDAWRGTSGVGVATAVKAKARRTANETFMRKERVEDDDLEGNARVSNLLL